MRTVGDGAARLERRLLTGQDGTAGFAERAEGRVAPGGTAAPTGAAAQRRAGGIRPRLSPG